MAGPEKTEFEIVLRNQGDNELSFEFPTSQKYEITVLDANKKDVYQYSEGKSFTQAFETLTLKPQEKMKWVDSWDYSMAGKRVPEGEYTVTAHLKATNINGEPVRDKKLLTDTKTMYIPGENPVFKGAVSDGIKGNYKIKGEARPINGKFFYTVEDGHNQLIPETEMKTGGKYPQWKPFSLEISIPESKLPQNGSVILNLYERSKDGEIIHTHPVLLERFNNHN
ncbi:BsuPI-related putative proteinase inhibitor [Mesobacillus boroniphilus]|uniref:BsuPI-related putative proteinase inhibitor n=1 Tax=Mesobacillus boroniphilus TaxID=308892 RepID=UPI00210F84E2|nr:BsuPI-related putative proteinase inhibitor [Mesobacillus boroniphilus]